MSFSALERVMSLSKTKQSQRLLMMALAHRTDKFGAAWPGIKTLAKDINAAERNTTALVQKLKATGEIIIIQGGGRTNSNVYIITLGLDKTEIDRIIATHYKIKGDDSDINPDDSDRVLDDKNPDDSDINPDDSDINPDDSDINPDDSDRGTNSNLNGTEINTTSGAFDLDFSDCLSLYQNNISPTLGQTLKDDIEDIYSHLAPPPAETKYQWFQYAILETTSNGANNWKYCKAILERVNQAGSLAQHKGDRSNGQTSTSKSNRGPDQKTGRVRDSEQRARTGNGGNQVGAGQTPEMRAELARRFPPRKSRLAP